MEDPCPSSPSGVGIDIPLSSAAEIARRRHDDDLDSLGSRTRLDSCSSSSSGDAWDHLEPIEFEDFKKHPGYRDRIDSINEEDPDSPIASAHVSKLFSVAMQLKRKNSIPSNIQPPAATTRAKKNWRAAFALIKDRGDPWDKFKLDKLPVENAIRHRYNALKKTWSKEKVVVKMEDRPFGNGAMRECYRMKKLSNFSHNSDWCRDSNNYVAKRYMDEDTERNSYFDDVKLQMEAKLWGEEYNRHNPPKKVDIFMMAVLEFPERDGCPLFHVEHFIDGEYIKYNSNSGFVENRVCRQTPHAFSHFTFERSGHELIVVDVQGVGDLYTDPQIHTWDGLGYGDGNLGPKGMALFFHSHSCTAICRSLKLTPFDLTGGEKKCLSSAASSIRSASETVLRGNEVSCESPGTTAKQDFAQFFRQRSGSDSGNALSLDIMAARKLVSGMGRRRCVSTSDYSSAEEPMSVPTSAPIYEDVSMEMDQCRSFESNPNSVRSDSSSGIVAVPRRRLSTNRSDCSEDIDDQRNTFQDMVEKKSKPSNVSAETDHTDESVLGQVHWEMAKYHEVCRFSEDGTYDHEAALFHLKCSAECGILPATLALAKMYFGLPHDILTEVVPPEPEDVRKRIGFFYFEQAARKEDRFSMVFIARAFDSGLNLPDGKKQSYKEAIAWYEQINTLDEAGDDSEWGMDDPAYLLMARQAEIWLEGGEDLEKDPNYSGELYTKAADSAMACMKGRLANKYFMLAEEAWAQVEEPEE